MTRQDTIKTERRRRNTDAMGGARKRLSVDMTELDTDNYEYRWITDADGRVEMLTKQDDWDIVSDRDRKVKADSTDSGANVSVHAGTGATGAPVRQILVRKLKKYQDEDRAAKQRRIDETEAGLRRENVPGAEANGPSFYSPTSGGTSIQHGSKG